MTVSRQHRDEKELDKDEIYVLIDYIQDHPEDTEIQEKLVAHYEGLVHSLARKYSRNNENHEDLVQVGMIGLLVAIKRYDKSFDRAFEAFAVPTIIGEIKRFIRDKTWGVHVPRRIKELGPKINRSVEELTVELQRSPTVSDIASHIGVSEEEVLETMEMTSNYRALSIDYTHDPNADGGTFTLMDLIGEKEDNYKKIDIHMVFDEIMPILPEREQDIIRLIFFENLSQQEVGDLLGLSQMHVSRLQRRALRKLREVLGADSAYLFD